METYEVVTLTIRLAELSPTLIETKANELSLAFSRASEDFVASSKVQLIFIFSLLAKLNSVSVHKSRVFKKYFPNMLKTYYHLKTRISITDED